MKFGTSRRKNPSRVAFLYGAPRQAWLAQIAKGSAPDTLLWGRNQMAQLGIAADILSVGENSPGGWARPLRFLGRWRYHVQALGLLPVIRKYDLVFVSAAHSLLLGKTLLAWKKPSWVVLCLDLTNWLRRHHGWRRRIRAQLLRQADAIVCVSTAQLEFFHREARFPLEKLHFIPFGSDIAFFSPRNKLNGSHRYVLSVGRDLARDYATLIQAIRGLDIPVKIVTSPRNLRGLEPLPPNVEVLFDVSFVDLRELYAGAAFVVIPIQGDDYLYGSDCSGQTVLLDAMAMGKAAIISERPYVHDYVSYGKTGIAVRPEDPPELQRTILDLWRDPERAIGMGQEARRLAEEKFNTANFARGLAEVFHRVAAA